MSSLSSGLCIGIDLGEAAVLAIKPFDAGEDAVLAWAHSSGYHSVSVQFLECGYDLILCKRT